MKKQNIILLLVIVAVIVFVGSVLLKKDNNVPLSGSLRATPIENKVNNKEPVKELIIQAFRFAYNPDRIVVKRGERVKLVIANLDTLHGIRIPDLNLKGNDSIEFTAEKAGEFKWYCTNFCGEGHRQMQGTLIVEE